MDKRISPSKGPEYTGDNFASCQVTICNELGLHARAAAAFVKLAYQFSCEVTVKTNALSTNGKSIMGLLTLAASRGTELIIEAQGSDSLEAIRQLKELVEDKFGEN
jgi:phosphocarrier protein HPr